MNIDKDIEALATPLQDILNLLILLMQSIIMVSLMVQSIDSSDGRAVFLGSIGEPEYGHEGSGNSIAGNL